MHIYIWMQIYMYIFMISVCVCAGQKNTTSEPSLHLEIINASDV